MTGTGRCRVAIVGAGYVSKHHIKALRAVASVELVGIADVNLAAAKSVAELFGLPAARASLAELAELKPNVVYVLTPPSTHCAIALQALDMGCHVFVEKPMAETVAECDAMIAKARERKLLLSVNHSDRLDPVVLKALQQVRDGACGEVVSVDFFRGSDYAPYAGGVRSGAYGKGSYPFQDIGVHALYLLEAFLGPIDELNVDYRSVLGDPNFLFDDWHGVAKCKRGIGRMHLSWAAKPMQNRLLVQGTRGTLEVDRFLQTIARHRLYPGPKFVGMVIDALTGAVRRFAGVTKSVVRFALRRLPPSPGIYAGAQDFARAVLEGRAPAVSAEEGRRMVALLEPVCRRADDEAAGIFAARRAPLAPVDVLVTGAAGFLGGALLCALLAEGKRVRVLVRRRAPWLAELPVQVVVGDLGDPQIVDHAIAGARMVYHLGAAMRGSAEQFRAGTTVAVQNVIESCLRHRTERLVYVSSLSVLDHAGRPDESVLREDAPYEPYPAKRGLYTQSKLEAERTVLDAIATRGLPAVVLRPGQIFGRGAEHVPPNGVIALAGRWLLVGDGELPLPLVYVEDVVGALLLAGTREGVVGKMFNIVDTSRVSQNEYVAFCRKRLERLKLLRVPYAAMLAIASAVDRLGRWLRRDLPLSPYRVRSLRPLDAFDVTAARTLLGWEPRVGTRAGLERTFSAPRD